MPPLDLREDCQGFVPIAIFEVLVVKEAVKHERKLNAVTLEDSNASARLVWRAPSPPSQGSAVCGG